VATLTSTKSESVNLSEFMHDRVINLLEK